MQLKPQTKYGKWSVWLNAFFFYYHTKQLILSFHSGFRKTVE